MNIDEAWMARCLQLAEQGSGRTAPNPMVGCVIVRDGQILGEGYHPQAGQPHAEVIAIASAQSRHENLEGATLYVNLEPCNHYGRTPPCTEAIIAAGIKRVVVGMIDPDPRVAGSGCDRLRNSNLEVTIGVLEKECRRLNEGFCHRIQHQRPFGIFKYAMTLDGKIATTTGDSIWITGSASRHAVHKLRSSCDAIITGGNTVRLDNPALTTHGISEKNPLRVVLSKSLDLPLDRQIWQTDNAPTLLITDHPHPPHPLTELGIEILTLDPFNPLTVMAELGDRGCNTVLWECGGRLAAEAIRHGTVQKIYAFIAPKIIGGEGAPTPVGDLGKLLMSQAITLTATELQQIGEDWLISGYLPPTFS